MRIDWLLYDSRLIQTRLLPKPTEMAPPRSLCCPRAIVSKPISPVLPCSFAISMKALWAFAPLRSQKRTSVPFPFPGQHGDIHTRIEAKKSRLTRGVIHPFPDRIFWRSFCAWLVAPDITHCRIWFFFFLLFLLFLQQALIIAPLMHPCSSADVQREPWI